jgi:hypothetical protein
MQLALDFALWVYEGQECVPSMSDWEIAHLDMPVVRLLRRQLIDVFLFDVR